MKIVNITGGLGNQMWQYAFAIALRHCHPNEEIYIDTQHYNTFLFKKFRGINLHNGYELDRVFSKATIPIAGFKQISKISYWIPNYVLSRLCRKVLPIRNNEYISPYSMNYSFDKEALYRRGNCYYEGYWQSIQYVQDIKKELLDVFSHPAPNEYNAKIIHEMTTTASVGIHVRRGDYLNEPEFRGICGIKYYQKAINEIVKDRTQHTFFIFSNDMEWCRENLFPLMRGHEIRSISGNTGANSCWDMFLMTHCDELIIANSSFSWWGAFLNKEVKRVYAPYPWLNRDCHIDIYEKSWIKIK